MRKILFIIPSLSHGGTNRSLQNLISLLDKKTFDIYVLSQQAEGEYKNTFKKYNLITPTGLIYYLWNSSSLFMRGLRLFDREIKGFLSQWICKKYINKLEKKYKFDIAIAFQEREATYFTSLFSIKKIAWIHCDYDYYIKSIEPDLILENHIYEKFNNIICVSQYTTQTFIKNFPHFRNKVKTIYNSINTQIIQQLADQTETLDPRFQTDAFRIVSIGRIDPVKRFDKIPWIIQKAKELGVKKQLKWFIIGDGKEKHIKEILRNIQEYNSNNDIILLGSKSNPYPYIKHADLLISTSLSEACPYVIIESEILHTPILSTNYESAKEIIAKENGIISELTEIPYYLSNIINNKDQLYTDIKKSAELFNYSNNEIIHSVEHLLN